MEMIRNISKELLWKNATKESYIYRIVRWFLRPFVIDIMLNNVRIFVDPKRVRIAKTAAMSNALLNTNSGTITIGEYTFCGQNVSIITGTHDYSLLGKERMSGIPQEGQDIIIGDGVWIGSNATILGPCIIGDNAVVAAGAVVTKDIDSLDIVAGVPARRIGKVIERRRKVQ